MYGYSINIVFNKKTTHSLVIKAIYTPLDCYLRILKIIFLMNNRYRLNILLGISQHLITTGKVSVELAWQWGLGSCANYSGILGSSRVMSVLTWSRAAGSWPPPLLSYIPSIPLLLGLYTSTSQASRIRANYTFYNITNYRQTGLLILYMSRRVPLCTQLL